MAIREDKHVPKLTMIKNISFCTKMVKNAHNLIEIVCELADTIPIESISYFE